MIYKEHFKTTSLDSEILEELLPQFIIEITNEFEKLLENFNSNNHQNVREIAHKIRGTTKVYGAFEIEKSAEQIEHFFLENNEDSLLESIEGMRKNIKRINKKFNSCDIGNLN